MSFLAKFNTLTRSRTLNALAVVTGIFAMSYAFYLQHFEYLDPCPLCIFDRVFLLGIMLTLLAASVHNPARSGQRLYAALCFLFTLGGLASSSRHVWLQHLPADQVPACGPGLNYLLDAFPLSEVLELVFRGSGECAEIHWQFFGFSLPEITLAMFFCYGIFNLLQFSRKNDLQLFQ